MPQERRVVRTIGEFRRQYRRLRSGDAVIGPLALRPGEEVKLLDLMDRGVSFFPPVLAQVLSRSKVAQAEILGAFMIPHTFVAYALPDLAARLADFHPLGRVVTKRDRAHLGLGVSLWPSLEALYSLGGLQALPYPLVVQPFLDQARDLRVVVVGDHAEAYERVNPGSFRKNLFQGGAARPVTLAPEQLRFCQQVMARGRFPYAILDLLSSLEGGLYLSEINLKGGLTGARLNQAQFRGWIIHLEEDFYRQWASSSTNPP
jgi:ribosomal protein S6--L-glutamate ligase